MKKAYRIGLGLLCVLLLISAIGCQQEFTPEGEAENADSFEFSQPTFSSKSVLSREDEWAIALVYFRPGYYKKQIDLRPEDFPELQALEELGPYELSWNGAEYDPVASSLRTERVMKIEFTRCFSEEEKSQLKRAMEGREDVLHLEHHLGFRIDWM